MIYSKKRGLLKNIWKNITEENITEKLKSEIASFRDRINEYKNKIKYLFRKKSRFDYFLNDIDKK